jgi:hypothetical protein
MEIIKEINELANLSLVVLYEWETKLVKPIRFPSDFPIECKMDYLAKMSQYAYIAAPTGLDEYKEIDIAKLISGINNIAQESNALKIIALNREITRSNQEIQEYLGRFKAQLTPTGPSMVKFGKQRAQLAQIVTIEGLDDPLMDIDPTDLILE